MVAKFDETGSNRIVGRVQEFTRIANNRRCLYSFPLSIVTILGGLWIVTQLNGQGLSDVSNVFRADVSTSSNGYLSMYALSRAGEIKPSSSTGDESLPRTFVWSIDDLVSLREKYRSGQSSDTFNRTLKWLRRDVKKSVDEGLTFSVTSAVAAPLSGDKHDYQSMGYYWWPCSEALVVCNKTVPEMYGMTCNATSGLPWVVCDGRDNEKTKEYSSKEPMQRMTMHVTQLALLWWYTGNEEYADIAANLLRVFFLMPETKMNPNLNFAQWVPGLENFDSVNGFGIIEIKDWSELLDAVAILRTSGHWPKEDDEALMQWFRDLLKWMLESERGNLERHRRNNHGVWFHQTALAIALHVGDVHAAKVLSNDLPWFLIDQQFELDGELPEEVARPRPIHYVCYALTAFLRGARLASFVDVDVWSHLAQNEDSDDRQNYLRNGVKWTMPYFTRAKEFPYFDVDRGGRKGEIWHRCIEPVAIALKSPWGQDPEFKAMCENGLTVQKEQYWIEPRVYGQPVYAVFDLEQ